MHERYFDNAATTPVDPRVVAEMLPFLTDFPGNASSIHQYGQAARNALDIARDRVASLINAEDPSQITFCSGSSEANNWVLQNFANKKVAVSPYEHSSILKIAARDYFTILPVSNPPQDFDLLAYMWVNNEVGSIFDVSSIQQETKSEHVLVDVTQGLGKLPFDVQEFDYVSASGHKFYAPKGVGFLYQRDLDLEPYLLGGGQEFGRRGSTANVAAIVAIGFAAYLAQQEMQLRFEHASHLKAQLSEELLKIPDIKFNGPSPQSPYILSVSFWGIEGETLLIELDRRGFCLSAGAACSSTSNEPSPVLIALGLEPEWLRGTIRISFGQSNTERSTQDLGIAITEIVNQLRSLK